MKNDIDKIDEQIEAIQNARKKPIKEKPKETVTPITDTKKLDTINQIAETEIETTEETKKMNTIEEVSESVQEEALPSNPEEPSLEEKTPKKKIPVIYIVFGVVILLLFIVLISLIIFKNNQKNTKETSVELSEKDKEKVIKNYGDSIVALLAYYKEKEDKLLTYDEVKQLVKLDHSVDCKENEIHEDGTIYLSQCYIDNSRVRYTYGNKAPEAEPVLPEGTVRIYVTSSGAYLKKPKSGIKNEIYDVPINEPYSGLKILDPKGDYIYYCARLQMNICTNHRIINFKTGKRVLEGLDYSDIVPINLGSKKYDTKYVLVKFGKEYSDSYWKVYNVDTGSPTLPESYSAVVETLDEYSSNEFASIEVKSSLASVCSNCRGLMNYKNGSVIIPAECSYLYKSKQGYVCPIIDPQDYKTKETKVYNLSGTRQLESVKILDTINDGYAIGLDNQNIKIYSFDGKEIYNYGKVDVGDTLYGYTYSDKIIFKFVSPGKVADFDYDLEDSCKSFIYHLDTKKGEIQSTYCYEIHENN